MDAAKIQTTRIAAYGLVTSSRRILLCRLSKRVNGFAGHWTLPGGGLNFGEDPADGMVREVFEETGLTVKEHGVANVNSDSGELSDRHYHNIRIVYYTELLGGALTSELDGTTDLCKWFSYPETNELALVDLVRVTLPLVFDQQPGHLR